MVDAIASTIEYVTMLGMPWAKEKLTWTESTTERPTAWASKAATETSSVDHAIPAAEVQRAVLCNGGGARARKRIGGPYDVACRAIQFVHIVIVTASTDVHSAVAPNSVALYRAHDAFCPEESARQAV